MSVLTTKKGLRIVFKKILFSFVIFLFFLLIVEIVFRTMHIFGASCAWHKGDKMVGARHIPDKKYWYCRENDHPVMGRINKYGWRDTDWELNKPAGTYRIAVLGDSFVEAFQVERERSFECLTEEKLNSRYNRNVELMNFGKSGYTQTEELIILQNEALKFNPDMVIVFFFPDNDIADVRKETTTKKERPFFVLSDKGNLALDTSFSDTAVFRTKNLIRVFQQYSALITLVTKRYTIWKTQKEQKEFDRKTRNKEGLNARGAKRKLQGAASLCTANPDPEYVKSYKLNKMLFEKMAAICKERDIEFMLVCLDRHDYIPANEEKLKNSDESYDGFFFEKDLEEFAAALNIHYVGLQSVFRGSYLEQKKALHWGHWNYDGHQVVSEEMTKRLSVIIDDNQEGLSRVFP